MRRRQLPLIAAASAFGLSRPALAQDNWPARTIRIIVTFPPGGSSDIVARVLADVLSQRLPQRVIVDNRPGAEARWPRPMSRSSRRTATHGCCPTPRPSCCRRRSIPVSTYDPVNGFTAHRLSRRCDDGDRGQSAPGAGDRHDRADRLDQGAARPAGLRHIGRRVGGAYLRRAVPDPHRHAVDACALSRQRADAGRPAGRRHPAVLRYPAAEHRAHPRRPPARHRRHLARAPAHRARRCRPPRRPAFPACSPTTGSAVSAPARLPPAVTARIHDEVGAALALPIVRQRMDEHGFDMRQ